MKYNAEAYTVRFAREANISLKDVGKTAPVITAALLHFLPPAQMHKALYQLPVKSRCSYHPSRRPG